MARPKTPKKTGSKKKLTKPPTRPPQGADRRALREMLQALEAEGALGKRGRRGFAEAGALPEVGVVDVVEKDPDGDLLVRLTKGQDAPLVPLTPGRDAAVP